MEIPSWSPKLSWVHDLVILSVSHALWPGFLPLTDPFPPKVRFLDIYQVTQALNTVLTNQKQLAEMRRSWEKIDFESVRNQSALVCNCRHEDLIQLLEVEFRGLMDGLAKSTEPVRDVMAWADKCCERLMGPGTSTEERGTMSSRSVLIRWGYVTSQVMRDLVRYFCLHRLFFC
jgi:regulatory factor X